MAEGTDNVGRQSCDDSLYDERNLRLPTVTVVFAVEAMAGNMAVALHMRWERSLTSLNLQEAKATLHPAPTSAEDGLDPLQLALVLICMCTHTNEHVLQFPLCGGGCMYVVVIYVVFCVVCVCIFACVTVCSDYEVCVCGVVFDLHCVVVSAACAYMCMCIHMCKFLLFLLHILLV